MKPKQEHDLHTRMISLKPSIIGLDGIILSTGEAHILNGKNTVLCEPDDLMFDPTTHTLYNIEYKLHGKHSGKAKMQLRRTKDYLERIFESYKVVNLYVHDNYKVSRIR